MSFRPNFSRKEWTSFCLLFIMKTDCCWSSAWSFVEVLLQKLVITAWIPESTIVRISFRYVVKLITENWSPDFPMQRIFSIFFEIVFYSCRISEGEIFFLRLLKTSSRPSTFLTPAYCFWRKRGWSLLHIMFFSCSNLGYWVCVVWYNWWMIRRGRLGHGRENQPIPAPLMAIRLVTSFHIASICDEGPIMNVSYPLFASFLELVELSVWSLFFELSPSTLRLKK